jgi:uncharacterized protein (DUF1697 family)
MARQIALLRGVNVGGHRRVPMGALRELLAGLGYEDVGTYLQSGNIVLTSDLPPDRLARELEQAITDGLGADPDVVVRSRDELAEVIERNPLGDVAIEPKRFQVVFLSQAPDPAVVRELEAADLAPEQVAFRGREIYAWHADGIQRSPLAKLLADRRLGGTGTARNWNTVTKLLELADAQPPASTTS